MSTEDMIWMILDKQFCSFKTKFEANTFCTNEYNLTGRCNKTYCPLANGRYATIKEEDGKLYLCVKTIERAHSPANLWEKILLPEDIPSAVQIIEENLAFWPVHFRNKVKERLVRLHQCVIRYRKWYYKAKPRLVTVHKKFERREQRRELKALVAAKLDFAIKQELLERLKQGTYEPFINLNNKAYTELLREEKRREKLALKGRRKNAPEKVTEDGKEKEKETGDGNAVFSFEDPVDFVEAEDDEEEYVGDMEDFAGEMEGEDDVDSDEEQELELEDDGQDELRMDILKHIPINLSVETGDDEEMARLKKRLLLKRKRRLEQKHEEERKRSQQALKKKKHYGPHVEIEYEDQPTSTQTTTSW